MVPRSGAARPWRGRPDASPPPQSPRRRTARRSPLGSAWSRSPRPPRPTRPRRWCSACPGGCGCPPRAAAAARGAAARCCPGRPNRSSPPCPPSSPGPSAPTNVRPSDQTISRANGPPRSRNLPQRAAAQRPSLERPLRLSSCPQRGVRLSSPPAPQGAGRALRPWSPWRRPAAAPSGRRPAPAARRAGRAAPRRRATPTAPRRTSA